MITTASLKSSTIKDLTELAKSHGLAGYRSMSKAQLIQALVRTAKKRVAAKPTAKAKVAKPVAPAKTVRSSPAPKAPNPAATAKASRITRKIHAAHEQRESRKDLARPQAVKSAKPERDRIVLMVRDPYWLHAVWQVTRTTMIRAQAAMAEHWHTARPILRLSEVETGPTTSSAEKLVRTIDIHGGVQNWYIDIQSPAKSYRVDIGFRADNGKFFAISRSNVVSVPAPGASDTIDENWSSVAEDYEKVYALSGGYNDERSGGGELQELFEERLRRPMGPAASRYGIGAERLINRHRGFQFDVEAEMIVFGTTRPDARVTLGGEPVKLRPDGTFTVRLAMPDKRQVIPVVAGSADGVEQRTVVLAVERNTKVLEPMLKEQNES